MIVVMIIAQGSNHVNMYFVYGLDHGRGHDRDRESDHESVSDAREVEGSKDSIHKMEGRDKRVEGNHKVMVDGMPGPLGQPVERWEV